jgi:3-hydroxyisobutyrate dehydrogenase-like beta-hydroxyacid dehydrogenase
MGAPMAANIAQAESSLTDFNRTPYGAAARTSAAEGAHRQRPKALKTHHSPAI